MRNLSVFPRIHRMDTTVTVSFTDTSGGLVRAVYTGPRPCRWEEGRSDDPDRLRPGKADLDQPRGTGDPRWLEVFFIGLGAVVYLGFSFYFAYRAWLA